MHVPITVKSPNNISKWQMGFNSAFKGLMYGHGLFKVAACIARSFGAADPRHVLLAVSEQQTRAAKRRLFPYFLQMADCCCLQVLVSVCPSLSVFLKNPFGIILLASSFNVETFRSTISFSFNTV
jgi:hypothetical protein